MSDNIDTVTQQPKPIPQPRPAPQTSSSFSLSAIENGKDPSQSGEYGSERLTVELVDIEEDGTVTSRHISGTHQEELQSLYLVNRNLLRVLIVAPQQRSDKLYSSFWTSFTSDDNIKDATWGSLDFWVFKSVLLSKQHGAASIPILAKPGRMKGANDYPAIRWAAMPRKDTLGATLIISFPVDKADSESLYREERYSQIFRSSLCTPDKKSLLEGPLDRRCKMVIFLLLGLIGRQSHYNLRILQDEEDSKTENRSPEPDGLKPVKDYTRLARDYVDMFRLALQTLGYMDNSSLFKLLSTGNEATDLLLDEANTIAQDCVRRAKDLREAQDRRFNFLTFETNMHESQSVKRLTVLATIFLPLSLGTGLLSMQSRITDLGLILYDYAGLIMNLAALIVIYMVLVNNYYFQKLARKLRSDTLFLTLPAFVFFSALIVFVIAFNIGMFKSVPLSLSVFKYGFIAIASLFVLAILVQIVFVVATVLFFGLVDRTFTSIFKIIVSCCLSCFSEKFRWGVKDDD